MSFHSDLDRERAQVLHLISHASAGWAEAMKAHQLAPPDLGFAQRLQDLSEAAAAEQLAWEQAHAAGLAWRPVPGAESALPPYELRPGTGRRGPGELWLHFDAAVMNLNRAIAGNDAAVVAGAFSTMAQAAADLAEAVRREDAMTEAAQQRARARREVA
ncbi:hypothetical protein [Conexibacter sp. DBS9H8]|uniref:hypothetical protein n=1 Tax=Conexibacter sp. DBS9H8 TaxID=2937801 RepID=UPI0020104719|nr:hypothetical protein [Conexibacter sp. DBS9H8]